jgi:uncharacterized BrkB/YihY/UPF0761 family membrane protein
VAAHRTIKGGFVKFSGKRFHFMTGKRNLILLAAAATLIIVLSVFWAIKTAQHNGRGTVTVGNDNTDTQQILVSETQYKRDNYAYSGLGVVIGMMLWGSVISAYKKL